jgi:anaerobic carbon-monoxide dehydrogenase catalytic subunit
MIAKMNKAGQKNAWDRLEAQLPQCGFGKQGICCRICTMGPCRITKKAPLGVCGADADTIVARNFLRAVAAGASAHSDHGRGVAEVFLATARGEAPDYHLEDSNYHFAEEKYTATPLEIELNQNQVERYSKKLLILQPYSLYDLDETI